MILISQCWRSLTLGMALTVALSLIHPVLSLFGVMAVAFTLYFFRDPERAPPAGEVIVSPADGRVLEVVEVDDPFVGKAWRIATFMGPFDVHVNRAPAQGSITSIVHTPGKKVKAYLMGDLDARERNRVDFEGSMRFSVTQYAGVFARRIVCFKKQGDQLATGERYGMIKFGSRADVAFPKRFKPAVAVGERVLAGETVVGAIDGKA